MITKCKRCKQDLPEPVPANRIGGPETFLCPECASILEQEKKEEEKKSLFTVPGQDKPYHP